MTIEFTCVTVDADTGRLLQQPAGLADLREQRRLRPGRRRPHHPVLRRGHRAHAAALARRSRPPQASPLRPHRRRCRRRDRPRGRTGSEGARIPAGRAPRVARPPALDHRPGSGGHTHLPQSQDVAQRETEVRRSEYRSPAPLVTNYRSAPMAWPSRARTSSGTSSRIACRVWGSVKALTGLLIVHPDTAGTPSSRSFSQ